MGVLDVDLYDSDNSFIENLPDVLSRSWRHQFRDVGSGQIVMDYADPLRSHCTRKRILKFKDGGAIRFAVVIGGRDQTTIGSDEQASKQRTIGGVGVNTLLNGGRVMPELGIGVRGPDQRGFGYMSGDYDDSGWSAAVQLYRQDEASFGYGPLAPAGWRDTTAWWVWSQLPSSTPGPSTPLMPIGTSFFRKKITMPYDGEIEFHVGADDYWKMWLDSAVIAERTEAFAWRDMNPFRTWLTAGEHQVAFEVRNVVRDSVATNAAGLIFAAYTVGFGGILVDLVDHTDNTWLCLDYPTTPPGMTPGAINKVLLDEHHFFGFLNEITQGAWTETDDENGVPWAVELNESYAHGTSWFDVNQKLAETAIDWMIDPDTLELRLYNKGTMGSASGVTLVEGTHYRDLSHSDAALSPTHLLTRKADGTYILIGAGGGQPVLGFLEAGGANDDAQAIIAATAVFTVAADTLRAAVESSSGETPYVDYSPGDTFDTVNIEGSNDEWQLVALTVTDPPADENGVVGGDAIYAIEAVTT